ncbi:hypothetical protein [Croceitalea rosinachiae]|uniref:Uncharacterized protein n=1 Tax=Croceitalea rosinachiae TaxID=3075596 RepID=A0ABU3ABK2_9FLAO|nr:hypothetical protein [Croceitalea sp. F388]MDT0607205.1 hypothetical protein [Croceitalea sp. F388]
MESHKHIEELLEKYFEATATVAEEEVLRVYFNKDSVATHLEQYQPMFTYFSKAKEEQFTKAAPFSELVKPRRKFNYRWVSVAAAVVLAFGVYFGNNTYQNYQEQRQARVAYQQTKEALNLLAENFGKGTEKVALLKEFEVAKQKVYSNN